jgi:DNA-binding response OmpR family regulator
MVAMVNSKSNIAIKQSLLRQIVVVEDDRNLADSIRFNLEHQGFNIRVVHSARSALNIILENPPDLVVLDVDLEDLSGVDLCRRLRSVDATAIMPILMLTSHLEAAQKVLGGEFGAQDYLNKSFSIRELSGRVNVLLRRAEGIAGQGPLYDDGVLVIDPWNFSVQYKGHEVHLTRKELRLLEELAQNNGRVILREVLFDRIWGQKRSYDSRTLDVHVLRLRKKLGNPELIETIIGIGYRLRKP